MSRRDDRISIMQMLDHAVEAVEMARGRNRPDLDENRMFSLAMVRLLEILGEAARRVSPETRRNCPSVEWAEIVGTRSRIVHDYDTVDFDILWKIVQDDLPSLIAELRRLLALQPSPIKTI